MTPQLWFLAGFASACCLFAVALFLYYRRARKRVAAFKQALREYQTGMNAVNDSIAKVYRHENTTRSIPADARRG